MPRNSQQSYAERCELRRQHREAARRRQQHRRIVGGVICTVLAVVVSVAFACVRECRQGSTSRLGVGSASSASQDKQLSAAEKRIETVRKRASLNCTGKAPSQLTDPLDYAKLGKKLMQHIAHNCASWEDFSNAESFLYRAQKDAEGKTAPYMIAINRAANTLTVLTLDADNNYTQPYMAMVCATGTYTPLGYFHTPERYRWAALFQDVFGQYATRIDGDILFHSVPYLSEHENDLEYQEFNKQGSAASLGCVRLQVCDAKWIYDNCPLGTPVVFYDDADHPGPMGKPGTIALDENDDNPSSATFRGFDPTDPSEANPWKETFRTGTAIRSDEAEKALKHHTKEGDAA